MIRLSDKSFYHSKIALWVWLDDFIFWTFQITNSSYLRNEMWLIENEIRSHLLSLFQLTFDISPSPSKSKAWWYKKRRRSRIDLILDWLIVKIAFTIIQSTIYHIIPWTYFSFENHPIWDLLKMRWDSGWDDKLSLTNQPFTISQSTISSDLSPKVPTIALNSSISTDPEPSL